MRGPSTADLVTGHLWIVDHFLAKYRHLGPRADLHAAGAAGLVEAAARFEPDKGRQFATYAWNWVKGYMLRELRCSHVVAVPEHTARRALAEGNPVRGVVVFESTETAETDEPLQEPVSDRSMRRRLLARLSEGLPDPELRALARGVLQGASFEQLADSLGVTQNRLEQLLARVERLLTEAFWMEGADNLSPEQMREIVRERTETVLTMQSTAKHQDEVITYLQGKLTEEKELSATLTRERLELRRELDRVRGEKFASNQIKTVRKLLRQALKELRA